MVSFSRDLSPPPVPAPPSSSSPHQISSMFSYLSSIREERDAVERSGTVPNPFSRTLLTSSSSWGDDHGFSHPPYPTGSSVSGRSLWTKYCLMCTLIGAAASILAAIFLVIAALFRYYTTSINYFETVPTYLPAILLSICGVSTIAFGCKRNRNIILLRITACWSLCSAALSSVITITTSLIHMNRLQTLKECVYSRDPPSCSCYSHVHVFSPLGGGGGSGSDHLGDEDGSSSHGGVTTYVFQNTPDCGVIHGILYSCLRAVFAISVVSVLLSIFLCMLLYQLIGHERKKAYWSRIRRINSDWSADFIACLSRPLPRDRSSVLPLMLSSSPSSSLHPHPPLSGCGWGPPPPYEEIARLESSSSSIQLPPFSRRPHPPPPLLRLTNSHSDSWLSLATPCPHPFSPTIAMDPGSLTPQNPHHRQTSSQGNVANISVPVSNLTLPQESLNTLSITSLSVPLPPSQWSSSTREVTTEVGERSEVAEAELTADGGDNSISATTCRSLNSEAVFEADSLEAGLNLELDLDLNFDLEARIALLDAQLAKLGAAQESKAKNCSLPSTPLMRVRRLFSKAGATGRGSSSATNLLSFTNVNWKLEQKLINNDKVHKSSSTRGCSLPSSPARRREPPKIPTRLQRSYFSRNKRSLDEIQFLR